MKIYWQILQKTMKKLYFLYFSRHESFNVDDPVDFSRSWFAWANTVFGDFILYLDKEYPHLLA
jgi:meiotically up-regulated gene 157 (Mug157) protein